MEIDDIDTEHAKRLSGADPLLPPPSPLDGTAAAGTDGTVLSTPQATGHATRSEVGAASAAALWRPLTEYRLDVRLAGDDPGEALEPLLARWEKLLAGSATRGDWDTAAVVVRPSRDTAGGDALLRHGFAPMRVLAVRPADRLGSGPPAVPGVRIRRAEPRDAGTVVRLQLELRRYDAQFGMVTPRPEEERAVAAETRELLAVPSPALWIAELYGRPLGYVHLQLPPASDWIAGHVAARRVGYLASQAVAEEARGSGVGSALIAHVHQLVDEEGVEAVLLHHALANPRSTPFWYAQGYRPLWTYWYRRPANP
ncbi:GNAT family N-acetyltransferase [Prauserella muralis]|uniref:Acetyltransferase n=1 Tax=Prauserella muralis TaxID=588067 RepID=A0A2V4B9V9_9PSEU|nr:GNAT family N-acetyltransferase [Prauserella muralis]PXY32144.1 acetyltransferase [Prauserella muralis]TWE24202.1 N-acetylglutamate synthase-like GNAT family acetyltransferase [Prauserella muralis]